MFHICFVSGQFVIYLQQANMLQDRSSAYVDLRHTNYCQNDIDMVLLNGSTATSYAAQQPTNVSPIYALPMFIRELPERLRPEDICYLRARKALEIPADEFRNELLKCYIQCVHPYMPMLDIEVILHAIALNDGANRVGLLLFQAVMFAGIAFAGEKHLYNAGFRSRRDAQKFFFSKTSVCEPVSAPQHCLLFSSYTTLVLRQTRYRSFRRFCL